MHILYRKAKRQNKLKNNNNINFVNSNNKEEPAIAEESGNKSKFQPSKVEVSDKTIEKEKKSTEHKSTENYQNNDYAIKVKTNLSIISSTPSTDTKNNNNINEFHQLQNEIK